MYEMTYEGLSHPGDFEMKKLSLAWILIGSLIATSAFAQDKPRLGLNVSALQASPLLLQHLRLAEGEGLMVSNVAVGGELEAAGLSQGDIVLAIDGHALTRPSDLYHYVSTLPQGTQVSLDVIQKGEHKQIILKLDNLPDEIVWKYTSPISGPSQQPFQRRQLLTPIQPHISPDANAPQSGQQAMGSASNATQRMTFKSILSTEEGTKSSTVTIYGSPQDSESEIEIELGNDTYKVKLGDLDQLPEDAQKAAQNALKQSNSFSFSFGSSGGSLMDEMMQRHQEQMQMMDDIFFRNFFGPAYPQAPQQPMPKSDVLVPVQPSSTDIKS